MPSILFSSVRFSQKVWFTVCEVYGVCCGVMCCVLRLFLWGGVSIVYLSVRPSVCLSVFASLLPYNGQIISYIWCTIGNNILFYLILSSHRRLCRWAARGRSCSGRCPPLIGYGKNWTTESGSESESEQDSMEQPPTRHHMTRHNMRWARWQDTTGHSMVWYGMAWHGMGGSIYTGVMICLQFREFCFTPCRYCRRLFDHILSFVYIEQRGRRSAVFLDFILLSIKVTLQLILILHYTVQIFQMTERLNYRFILKVMKLLIFGIVILSL